jgi:5S rRNA maturation endonuclease (ribonuclease M5)
MAFNSDLYADLIRNEIAKVKGAKRGLKYTMICCPYHNDNHPSGRVTHNPEKPRSIGYFTCYACGAGRESPIRWNELAAKLGLQQFGKDKAESADVPAISLEGFEERLFGKEATGAAAMVRFPLLSVNSEYAGLEGEWRGFSLEFLTKVGAELAFDPVREKYYVLLVANVNGEEVGYVRAELQKAIGKFPSYLNKAGEWSLTKGLLFFDYAIALMRKKELSTMVLVEGPRDALRLLREGIPCVCILGTHSWSPKKTRLLEFADVEKLILLFDGDEAGEKATELVYSSTRKSFNVKKVKLWTYKIPKGHKEDKLDPGNMPDTMVQNLKKHLE